MKNQNQRKNKNRVCGKVIRHFCVEIADASSDSALYSNPSNPYVQMSEEERLRDFVEMFGVLWAESCREALEKNSSFSDVKK